MRIFFGPATSLPSWEWVGADVARHLADFADVRFIDNLAQVPDEAVVFWIKHPGSSEMADEILRRRVVLIFFPVDAFSDEVHIQHHQYFIEACSLVCLHAHSLASFFPLAKIAYVDHYNKYGISYAERSPGDTILWIGAYQYLPYAVHGLAKIERRPKRLLFLTNYDCDRARVAAEKNAEKCSTPNYLELLSKWDVEMRIWSELSQRRALLTCRAAFDVKFIGCFNQLHKPPTKIQKYQCSGIPCSINAGSVFTEQLKHRPVALDQLELFADDVSSREAMFELSREMSLRLTLSNVARQYLVLVERALALR